MIKTVSFPLNEVCDAARKGVSDVHLEGKVVGDAPERLWESVCVWMMQQDGRGAACSSSQRPAG